MDKSRMNEIFAGAGIRLEETIAQGGSGCVYRISCGGQAPEKQVLKVVDIAALAKEFAKAGYSEALARERLLDLYERELELNKRITATRSEYLLRILQPYRYGSAEDDVCLCALRMPCYDTLRSLRKAGTLDEKTVVQLGIHICEALRVLHHDARDEYYRDEDLRFGVMIHMDIKPDNIFYAEDKETLTFMLGDFGSLADRGSGLVISKTPGYFPPETGKAALSEASDIFSLGVTLYYCLCEGEDPDAAAEKFGEARCRGVSAAKPPRCSSQLWEVIEKATAQTPENRYQTAAQMREALAEVAQKQKSQLQQANTAMAIVMAAGLVCSFVGKILDKSTKVGRLEIDGENVFFDGPLKNDRPNGKGVYSYRCGEETRTISGDFKWVEREKVKLGKEKGFYTGMKCGAYFNGWGTLEFPDHSFVGTMERGELRAGTMRWASGESYMGTWISQGNSAVADGKGVHTQPDGSRYEGEVKLGMYEGFGLMRYANGSVYAGQWKADKPHGEGHLTDAEGKSIHALWQDGNIVKILD